MKVYLIAAFSFLAVFGVVQSFHPNEIQDIACSIPDKYLRRFLNCTISRGPKIAQKVCDIFYECVDTFYEVDDKLDAILLHTCDNNVRRDDDVDECLDEKTKDLGNPDQQDAPTMEENILYCLHQA
ncbi:venom protein 7.1-like isoform X2 [Centruroides vittatus]|uniref:venom protein 7.1-like isoform X2 n=1 Tax=Centruroides vittatus TaxID=120091 RepID=UPI00350EA1B2